MPARLTRRPELLRPAILRFTRRGDKACASVQECHPTGGWRPISAWGVVTPAGRSTGESPYSFSKPQRARAPPRRVPPLGVAHVDDEPALGDGREPRSEDSSRASGTKAFIAPRDRSPGVRQRPGMSLERRWKFSAHVFDDSDEFVQAVAVVPGELNQLLRPLDDDTTFGRPDDRNATPTSELD